MSRAITTTCLLAALALFVATTTVSAATMAEDGRCAGMPQQLEQERLDNLFNAYRVWQCTRTTVVCKLFRYTDFYSTFNLAPDFPGQMVAEWAQFPAAFQQLDPKKLSKYDYSTAAFYFNKSTPFLAIGMDESCSYAFEDWWMYFGAAPLSNIMTYIPGFVFPSDPYQELWTPAVYDDLTFNGLLGELGTICPWTQARIAGDWWTAAYAYSTSHGGFIPSYLVDQDLGGLFFLYDVVLNATLGIDNPIVDGLVARGFPLTFPQYIDLLTALSDAQACVIDYFDYELAVAPGLTVLITSDIEYWNARVSPTCQLQSVEVVFGLTPARAKYLFDTWRARLSVLIPEVNASFYATYPTYLGYNKTYLHVSESSATILGVEFLGYNNTEICQTENAYANGTNWRAIQLQSLQQIADQSAALWSVGTTTPPILPRVPANACNVRSGLTNAWPGGFDPNEPTPPVFMTSTPGSLRNLSVPVLLHEHTHVNQISTIPFSTCTQCWMRRMSSYIDLLFQWGGIYSYFNQAALYPFGNKLTAIEGGANFIEYIAATQTPGVYDPYQQVNAKFDTIRSMLSALLQVGFWAPPGQGWTSTTDCAVYRQNHDWTPAATMSSAINSCAARQAAGPLSSVLLMFYNNGMQYYVDWQTEAKAACSAAFDQRYFNTIMFSSGMRDLGTTEMMYRDYIDCGCCKTIFSEFGDCWRTVQPVRNGGGVAYSPALPN